MAITLSQLPRMLQLYQASETFFWKFFERILFTLRHLQSFLVVFIEQAQIIEKSKASVAEFVSCFATVKARIQERQSDVNIEPS